MALENIMIPCYVHSDMPQETGAKLNESKGINQKNMQQV